ncbi:MAG: histidine phosphatase family protein [Planctomycetota bacterium]|jgi:broad specificity phosphatase PhoE
MAKLILIQTGQTTWEADERIESPNGSPLTDAGIETARVIAEDLAGQGLSALYRCNAEPERQTAEVLARALKVKVVGKADLRDLDYGLWQGLTASEIKRRQPKLYKQWVASPDIACPPGGEMLADAQQRLVAAIKAITRRRTSGVIGVVARPLVIALLRCMLNRIDLAELQDQLDLSLTWVSYELDDDALP